ncbi:hypothetical protein M885DRAFT_249627 [Pelagophyceae sp. CCMP2097]|nr:hypothetical protein M885DRAFT_249627 [Pelagophyceae sp. CCMP2097]
MRRSVRSSSTAPLSRTVVQKRGPVAVGAVLRARDGLDVESGAAAALKNKTALRRRLLDLLRPLEDAHEDADVEIDAERQHGHLRRSFETAVATPPKGNSSFLEIPPREHHVDRRLCNSSQKDVSPEGLFPRQRLFPSTKTSSPSLEDRETGAPSPQEPVFGALVSPGDPAAGPCRGTLPRDPAAGPCRGTEDRGLVLATVPQGGVFQGPWRGLCNSRQRGRLSSSERDKRVSPTDKRVSPTDV